MVLVVVGLIVSGLVNVWIEAPADDALPGIALSSQTLLVVERSIAFFAAWLLVLVVAVRALAGELPVEVSGRGLRYADAPTTEEMVRTMGSAIARMEAELAGYRLEQNDLRRMLEGVAGNDRIQP